MTGVLTRALENEVVTFTPAHKADNGAVCVAPEDPAYARPTADKAVRHIVITARRQV